MPERRMLKRTGATEGYIRSMVASSTGAPKNSTAPGAVSTNPLGLTTALNSPSATGREDGSQQAVESMGMERMVQENSATTAKPTSQTNNVLTTNVFPGRGFHMPPEVLGFVQTRSFEEEKSPISRRRGTLTGLNIRARKRSSVAIKSTQSKAAVASAAAVAVAAKQPPSLPLLGSTGSADTTTLPSPTTDPSMFTMLAYKGMEVLFAVTGNNQLMGVCSRTQLLFQTLTIVVPAAATAAAAAPSAASSSTANKVVSVSSNNVSGMIVVALQDGTIQTFLPVETTPTVDSDDEEYDENDNPTQRRDEEVASPPAAIFGKFRWVNGITLLTKEVFYQPNETVHFGDRRSGISAPGELVDISTSYDHKILVAHRNQLAVFDASLPSMDNILRIKRSGSSGNSSTSLTLKDGQDGVVVVDDKIDRLLWTTMLPSNVVTAKLSGDGQDIVVVLACGSEEVQEGNSEDDDNININNTSSITTNNSTNLDRHVLTFVHDAEDGSDDPPLPLSRATSTSTTTTSNHRPSQVERTTSVGILYKPGPPLQHFAPVTRISFRGLGHNTSMAHGPDDHQGHDLLLTYCAEDSSVRIFNQNGWQQLMQWSVAPHSRVDWIRGSSAFSLGDLESQKKSRAGGSGAPSRTPSNQSLSEMANGGGGGGASSILGTHAGASTHAAPNSAVGAWIAEVNFRSAFPALRLSRLSYMKRGAEDARAAHFESVSAVLPAGSLLASSVLHSDDMGLAVHGIWPAWNPWLSEATSSTSTSTAKEARHSDTLRGSAMEFLGLSSVAPPTGAYFGETYLGGTHSPPSELRLVGSHPHTGRLVLMEFPLWGDEDFGAMELGNPLRYVLSLSDVETLKHDRIVNDNTSSGPISLDYESTRLCAQIDKEAKSISISWRKPGTMSIYSPSWRTEQAEAIPRTSLFYDVAEPVAPELYHDVSVIPVPLSLPQLNMPRVSGGGGGSKIVAMHWWPDGSFGGPPLIVALTESGTLLLFEIPPPWAALEPTMPTFDPNSGSTGASSPAEFHYLNESDGGDVEDDIEVRHEYEVMVTPHPDFGLGLRLESPMDGMPAVAGSFKNHPLNGGGLPAEKTGMIVLGDELLSVNGVTLENLTFDDIIATVRHVGAESGPGAPLCLRFRPVGVDGRRRKNTGTVAFSELPPPQPEASGADAGSNSGRRTMETMLGVSPKNKIRKQSGLGRMGSDSVSIASQASFGESQQEFGRLLAVIRDAIPGSAASSPDIQKCMVLTPWISGVGAPSPSTLRGAALLTVANGSNVFAKRLELPLGNTAEKARILELGTIDLNEAGAEEGSDTEGGNHYDVQTVQMVDSLGEAKCLAVCGKDGGIRLVFMAIEEIVEYKNGDDGPGTPTTLQAHFRQYKIFQLDHPWECQLRSSSISLLATMEAVDSGKNSCLKIWSARPDPSCREVKSESAIKDDLFGQDYCSSEIEIHSPILDFCFMQTGSLEAYSSLVVFFQAEVCVYQRRAGSLRWIPILRLTYPVVPCSTFDASVLPPSDFQVPFSKVSPLDMFPHVLPALRAALFSYDETHAMVSDWHPESLLAHLCTEENGAKLSLNRHVRRVFLWLSEQMAGTSVGLLGDGKYSIVVAPFEEVGLDLLRGGEKEQVVAKTKETSADLMASLSFAGLGGRVENSEETRLMQIQSALGHPKNYEDIVETSGKSREFCLAMSSPVKDQGNKNEAVLPHLLGSLKANELRVLWALGDVLLSPPDFGSIDPAGELALIVCWVHAALKKGPKDLPDKVLKKQSSNMSDAGMPLFLVKRQSAALHVEKVMRLPQIASAGCVAALLSDSQGRLLESLRLSREKFDWDTARELRLPFWVRSDDALSKVCEEIGQNVYRVTKDILKSAVFFIISGKLRTLRNLAAADSSESGQKFFKFLTSFDFSSARGRTAAEKNAFSLLRKNQYESAAAFFLLAQPPILKSAVETIATKMEDPDLAFLVARLAGRSNFTASGPTFGGDGFGGGSMLGLAGLGGGGGYAGMGAASNDDVPPDKEFFRDWEPSLGQGAKDFLVDRGLPSATNDACFSAAQFIWLGKREEACHWLSGFVGCDGKSKPCFHKDAEVPRIKQPVDNAMARDVAISSSNAVINFTSGPLLLKLMKASLRTRIASAMLVSNALERIGIELPSIRTILQNAEPSSIEAGVEQETSRHDSSQSSKTVAKSVAASSIFDSFDGPPKPVAVQPSMGIMSSSIFDDFDAPTPTSHNAQMVSSIFDDFSPPPPAAQNTTSSVSGQMTSSIFDQFDAPPPQKAPAPQSCTGQMSSSIFDAFDAPPTQKPTPYPPPSSHMTSSIFDTFDVQPPRAKPASLPSPTGQMNSSIFDSFDTAPADQTKILPELGNVAQPRGNESLPSQDHPKDEMAKVDAFGPLRSTPKLWLEWRRSMLLSLTARRLLREVASIAARFHGDVFSPTITRRPGSPLVPRNASHVLLMHCDGDNMLNEIRHKLSKVCEPCGCDIQLVVEKALGFLSSTFHVYRVAFAVLLHLSVDQVELAEDVLRNASQFLISQCGCLSLSNDGFANSQTSIAHVASLHRRRQAASLSWQIELCLWLHRGGALPLSGIAFNEAVVAVRTGLLVASWNRDFECLEALVRVAPDCLVNREAGCQLWTSSKRISNLAKGVEKKAGGTTSGGWEFLVDCRRAEATELLRPRSTGSFIIRPHSEDHGVFTLSFKTNLIPTPDPVEEVKQNGSDAPSDGQEKSGEAKGKPSKSAPATRHVKKDDVVQHAIIRLSDSGFRCGSFGPFATLMKLLAAVSSSLPFDLRFDQPPTQGVIKEEGSKPSPNSALLRELALCHSEKAAVHPPQSDIPISFAGVESKQDAELTRDITGETAGNTIAEEKVKCDAERRKRYGSFLELLAVSEIRKQLSSIAAARYDNIEKAWMSDDDDSIGSMSDSFDQKGPQQHYADSARMLRPLLTLCRTMEVSRVWELAPDLIDLSPGVSLVTVALNASETAIEMCTTEKSNGLDGGDAVIRRMIQPGSGVEFRTLRLGDGGDSAMVVFFSKKEAISWFIDSGSEKSEEDALKRLKMMEESRVIEAVDLKKLGPKAYKKQHSENGDSHAADTNVDERIRYRFVDPWEVEPLESREGETRGASLGRHKFFAFSLGRVSASCDDVFRSIGGVQALELWAASRGAIALTKAIASVHPPWERDAGGDMHSKDGSSDEPPAYVNSIRQHLYRNALFRRLALPQRFLALIQVELLDLKNLASPAGSLSLSVYALLRLKRSRGGPPLTAKARTLDSVATHPMKLGKSTGPNAPASWGSLVRFRFPLPEYTRTDGRSFDVDRETLFKGPPSVLQVSVYERKFMSDVLLGGADVKLDGLSSGGQLEEWVPLRTETNGINWFARIRLTLRFELMCLAPDNKNLDGVDEWAPSVGLRRIHQLSSMGGLHEDMKKSVSTPDILSYFESIVY